MDTIRVLNGQETLDVLPELCEVLSACVNGGASVGFMLPFSPQDAEPFWRAVAEAAGEGGTIHVVAEMDGKVVGTVQVGLASKPNQPHRGDLMKLLVHPSARGLGLARKLMQKVEEEAAKRGRTLLVLDTATGSDAEAIYPRLGWEQVGVIPDYALFPDGRYCGTTLFYKRIG
ncbi:MULTISPECIES: GNAT family N-acetyltransferase [Rhizobium/Agrobacterium group]|uniref:Acetyltransferase n=1 Tax=Agrobacterium tomkonis CFBP 6623 TaxID=1183432 RepID=A0A1S7QJ12_9HYPH|nr:MULTISPECIES: GNAT family N-acetyltransferase [Rhizobium/Agrobacterium group]KNY32289.1 GCN5 family acetyltransferase [Agrobacterium sp. SUL3]KRA58828.1 GCN5 family acetyltransferase [Rhizobium sp. Root651]MCD4661243.1 GNAT family N-acetyltransferase [Agrobacterium sp.]QCL90294.1 GNAT family N-acetyltransferase [Agrobacterium tumefaciens]TKT60333.1 GNAT family N-acetyltransferase [Agrobacterium sp. LC34]